MCSPILLGPGEEMGTWGHGGDRPGHQDPVGSWAEDGGDTCLFPTSGAASSPHGNLGAAPLGWLDFSQFPKQGRTHCGSLSKEVATRLQLLSRKMGQSGAGLWSRMVFEAAALGNLLGLASCCLPSPAISARGQKPGQVPGEHLAFCCEEGRIRKSNATMDWEPREGGREAGGAWRRLGATTGVEMGGACPSLGEGCPSWGCCRKGGRGSHSLVGPLSPSPAGQGWLQGGGLRKKLQPQQGTGCQAEESAVPNERSLECWLCLTFYNNTSFIWHYQSVSCSS